MARPRHWRESRRPHRHTMPGGARTPAGRYGRSDAGAASSGASHPPRMTPGGPRRCGAHRRCSAPPHPPRPARWSRPRSAPCSHHKASAPPGGSPPRSGSHAPGKAPSRRPHREPRTPGKPRDRPRRSIPHAVSSGRPGKTRRSGRGPRRPGVGRSGIHLGHGSGRRSHHRLRSGRCTPDSLRGRPGRPGPGPASGRSQDSSPSTRWSRRASGWRRCWLDDRGRPAVAR